MRKSSGLLFVICTLGLSVSAVGADSTPALTQSYSADKSVLAGMIVELKPKVPSIVEPLANQDLPKMLGVVVPVNDAPLVLTSSTISAQQVLVATSGRYNMLISDQNGPIKTGDYLTISSLAGVGMKADSTQPEVVGQAAGNFNGSSNVLGSVSLKGSTGRNVTTSIGSILVNVHLAANPLYQKSSTRLPGFLSKTANSVANKSVSAQRIYIGSFVLLATMLIVGSMLYGGVNSSITAIGRNPLAKKMIGRSLFRIVVSGLIVLIVGIFATYLILSL